jgi:Arginase family.
MSSKTYAGIPQQYGALETSKIVLIPVPYDGTSTFQKGADKGPEAFYMLRKTWNFTTLRPKVKCINKEFIWQIL